MADECTRDIQACPGDTVQIVEDHADNAGYSVFLDDKGGGTQEVTDSFQVQDDSARVRVIVVYGGGEEGSCKIIFQTPTGDSAAACFTRRNGEPTRSVTKYLDCEGGQ